MLFFKNTEKHILGVFVGDVAHHDSGSSIAADVLEIDDVFFGLLIGDGTSVSNCRNLCLPLQVVVVILRVAHGHHHGVDLHCHVVWG